MIQHSIGGDRYPRSPAFRMYGVCVFVCVCVQHFATLCNTLQHSATLCNTLQHFATLCNTLQHFAATLCKTLQHFATLFEDWRKSRQHVQWKYVVHKKEENMASGGRMRIKTNISQEAIEQMLQMQWEEAEHNGHEHTQNTNIYTRRPPDPPPTFRLLENLIRKHLLQMQ